MPKCNIHCSKCNMHRANAQHAPRNVQRIALNSHHATCNNTAASRSSLMSIAKLSFPARAWCAVAMRGARLMRVVSCTLHLGTRTIILQLASCALQATRCTGTARSLDRALPRCWRLASRWIGAIVSGVCPSIGPRVGRVRPDIDTAASATRPTVMQPTCLM